MASNPVQPPKNKGLPSVDSFSDLQRGDSISNDSSTPNLQKMKSIEQASLPSTISKPKKGGFQITRVVTKGLPDHLTEDHDGDSLDDLDETNTEDISSDIIDLPKTAEIDQDPSSSDTIQSLAQEELNKDTNTPAVKHNKMAGDGQVLQANVPSMVTQNSSTKPTVTIPTGSKPSQTSPPTQPLSLAQSDGTKADKPAEIQSTRFKVVKIESNKPFRRGRWTCLDFLDPPQKSSTVDEKSIERPADDEKGSGNSSAASSVHYVHGVDDPAKNPLNPTVVFSEGHPILEPQPLRPGLAQGHVTNGVDYNSASQNVPSSEQNPSVANAKPSTAQTALIPQQVPNVANTQGLGPQSVIISNASLSEVGNPSVQSYAGQSQGISSAQDFIGNPSLQSHSIPSQSLQAVDFRGLNTIPQHSKSEFSHVNQGQSTVSEAQSSGNTGKSSSASPDHEIGLQTGSEYVLKIDHDKPQQDHLDITFKTLSQNSLTPPLLEMVSATMNPTVHSNNDEDESGASTVAIDNKIEQAMDLVKSHLMFAVREEVEVLKEQIKELLEKNSQLEYENSVLRSSASPETLSQLSKATPPSSAPPPSSQNAPPSQPTPSTAS